MKTSTPPEPAPTPKPEFHVVLKTDIIVIGAGQASLSAAYHLKKRGLAPNRGSVVLDQSARRAAPGSSVGPP